MCIRPYDSRDRKAIRRILDGCATFTDEEIELAIEVIRDAEACPDTGDYFILCAEDEGQLMGYVCYGPIPITDRCFDLYWICVDRTVGRTGIGSALINAMEKDLKERGARHIYVDTSSTPSYNRARSFYEKNGYEATARFVDFYSHGDDKIVYRKIM